MALHSTVTHPAPRWGAPKHYGTFLALLIGGVLTIAAVAIAAIVIRSNDEASVGTAGVTTGEAIRPFVSATPAPLFLYLVATQEEADRYSLMLAQDEAAGMVSGMAGVEAPPSVTLYMAVDSPEAEAATQVMMQELYLQAMESGRAIQIIDLRALQ